MRKALSLITVLGILAVAGCGGADDAASPLDNALGYLPADAPFAVAIDTDTDGEQLEAAGAFVERFEAGGQLGVLLRGALEIRTGGFEQFERALGNEFVVGTTEASTFVNRPEGEDQTFVGAIEATDGDALDALVEREQVEEDGEAHGATIYRDETGDPFAIEGDTLIVAGSREELEAALERRDGDERLTEDDFEAATDGLPEGALLRVYLDVGGLLRASDDAGDALRVKWVDAVRTGGIALAFGDGEAAIDVNVDTDPEGLAEEDLPIAAGARAPQALDRGGEISLALRDPSQLVEFAQRVARAVEPDDFGTFQAGRTQVERRLDIDLERDLFGQIEDDLAVTIDPGVRFGARATVANPRRLERTLAQLGEVLPDVVESISGDTVGFAQPGEGEDFYALATAGGGEIVFGIVDGVFVLADDPALAAQLAAADTRPVEGAEGSVVLDSDAERALGEILPRIGADDLGGLPRPDADALGPLDRLVGSLDVSTERLRGSFTLTLEQERPAEGE